jgi:hypothetical protein
MRYGRNLSIPDPMVSQHIIKINKIKPSSFEQTHCPVGIILDSYIRDSG